MKKGTILMNKFQPSHESLLIYMGISGNYAKCLWFIDGKFYGRNNFYKKDILNDRAHFPIVGYVDYEKVLLEAVRSGIGKHRGRHDGLGRPQFAEEEADTIIPASKEDT